MHPRILCLVITTLLTGACTAQVDVPSLAPRPVEGILSRPTTDAVAATAPDPALDAKVAVSVAAATADARAFDTLLATARGAVARSGAATVGSEAWLDAQQALTALGAARGGVTGAIADLDAARLAAGAGDHGVDTARLDAALDTLGTLERTQAAAYDALAARLPDG